MGRPAVLRIDIISDASNANRGLDDTASRLDKFESGARRAGIAATAVVGGLAVIGKAAFDSASALQQSSGAVESIFGEQAAAVNQLATAASQAVGLSTNSYNELASVLGAQLKNLGVSQEDLIGTTDGLIQKGADLAATFGGTTAEAVQALSSLLKGERDPIERYGVSIKQAAIDAELAAAGQDKLTGAAKTAAEQQATMAILMRQTSDATGAFGRESNTAAGQQQRMSAEFENAKAALGEGLLPVVSQLAQGLAGVATFVGQNVGLFTTLAAILGGLALAVYAVNAGLAIYRTIQTVSAAATALMNTALWAQVAALLANPLTWIVIAVIAFVAAIVLAYQNCETFRNIVDAAGRVVAAVFGAVVDAIMGVVDWVSRMIDKAGGIGGIFDSAMSVAGRAVDILTAPIRYLIGLIQDVIGWISRISFPSPPGWMSALFGVGTPGLMGIPGPGLMHFLPPVPNTFASAPEFLGAAPNLDFGAVSSSGGFQAIQQTTIAVTVEGAIDPYGTARTIEEVLRKYGRSTGIQAAQAVN